MLFHHIRHTLRNLWRHRLYTTLNLSGLTIGMTAAMFIAIWVQNELRFDAYHRRAANIWRIKSDLKINDTETWHWGTTPMKTKALCAQLPGVVATVQSTAPYGMGLLLRRGADVFEETQFAYVGPGWFDMFDYDFAEGSARGFGDRPNDLLLTECLAQKFFGDRSAIGQTLRIDSAEFVVHGVLRNPQPASSFRENLLLPLEAHLRQGKNRQNDEDWGNFNYHTFVELNKDVSPTATAAQLTRLLAAAKRDSNIVLQLGALTDIHFDQSLKEDVFEKGSRHSVATFALIGLLVLLMAAINYVNLTTARAQSRARETGIRKMVGAGTWQMFKQFLGESALLACAAGMLAMGLVQVLLPWFSGFAERDFVLSWSSPMPWLLVGGTILVVVLMAGIYPAVLMAGFRPMQVLRGTNSSGGRSVFRQSLVVVQFAISVMLLVSTLIIAQQRAFIQRKEMGYERAQIFKFSIPWHLTRSFSTEQRKSMAQGLAQNIRQATSVAALACASDSPVQIRSSHSGSVKFDGLAPNAEPTVSQIATDEHFAQLFNLQMVDGRWFEAGIKEDKYNVVLNETAARKLGLHQPYVGQRFGFHGNEGRVIGIVRDFHFLPLHTAIKPLVMYSSPDWYSHYFIKTQPGQSPQALAAVENAWKQWFPDRPFIYTFLDEDFDKMYRTEQRAGLLFNVFAGIAIFIACLGLFGLVTFVAAQRTKEIGIRKVLGASVASVTSLLAKDFLKLVLIAIVAASPVAYYFMQKWLSDFAYRIDLQWWLFAGAGAVALLIAFLTVSFQSVKAALVNPVKSLKSE